MNRSIITLLLALVVTTGTFARSQSIFETSFCNGALQTGEVPVFEFCINGRIYTSSDPVWTFAESQSTNLVNGAVRTTYRYNGAKALKGLVLYWDRETVEGENYVRERLRLRSSQDCKFRLTNINGKNHFIFPRYTFESSAVPSALEIRIATYGKEVLENYNTAATYDTRSSRNLASCHMFHPDFLEHEAGCEVKGPFLFVESDDIRILTSYEHASQDKMSKKMNENNSTENIDAQQGVEGNLEKMTDDDLWFISSNMEYKNGQTIIYSKIRRGGYVEGEVIPSEGFYETVWYTTSQLNKEDSYESHIHEYLYNRITTHPISRKPDFYYNTWGMQRTMQPDMRECFTQERILKEIDLAAEMGMDIFIMDDGWQETFADWTANKERLPDGLAPLINRIKEKGMTPGIWLSLLGVDPSSDIAKEHPEWIILDKDGVPTKAQWGFPTFDLVGGYYDILLASMKRLVDQGIRFFKWDAINTLNSYQANLGHGNEEHSRKERLDRYNYLLPFRVVSLMRELREYCPEVVVEIDLTEPERALIGLMPLQEGKFFYMNNGASNYGDYSTYRSKSMRNSVNATHSVIPCELLTYACYPYNKTPYFSQRYNVNTILQAGHGIWGDLTCTGRTERKYIASQTAKAKRVLKHTAGNPLHVSGQVGSVPEIYLQSNYNEGWALLTAFSGGPVRHTHMIDLNTDKVLGVLNHSYRLENKGVAINFEFPCADESREVFVIGNDGIPVRILSSTGWIDDITVSGNTVRIKAGSDTDITVETRGEEMSYHISAGKTLKLSY